MVVACSPQEIEANDGYFSAKDFLAMPHVQKKFWLSGSISSLSSVAFAKSEKQGQCVFNWYFDAPAKRNGQILAAMERYPDQVPAGIVIAMLENACGRFVRPA